MATRQLTADELVDALDALDVHFLSGGQPGVNVEQVHPERLLAQLAAQPEARLRLSIVPLLLRHPDLASVLPLALELASESARLTLMLYYTAAQLLQQEHHASLSRLLGTQPSLPDLYSAELGICVTNDPISQLQRLAERHTQLNGLAINWVGTYEHAAQRLIKRLQHEALWVSHGTA
jgi:hypothetical protein